MNTSINAVGFDLSEDQQALIEKKLDRVKYADDLIVDLAFKVKEDKKFVFDTTINFRWGASDKSNPTALIDVFISTPIKRQRENQISKLTF